MQFHPVIDPAVAIFIILLAIVLLVYEQKQINKKE